MASTKIELIPMLQSAFEVESDERKKALIYLIIRNAEEGVYHDFESLLAFPKRQLVMDLEEVGLDDIARLVKEGEFDE